MNSTRNKTSLKIQPALTLEFEKAARPFLFYLASTIIIISISKDYSKVGLRWDWLALRLGYLPFMFVIFEVWQKIKSSNPTTLKEQLASELPLLAACFYVATFCSYFSLSTGMIASDYFLGIIQFFFGISIMPISALGFSLSLTYSLLCFVGMNYLLYGAAALPPKIVVTNSVPLVLFSILVYFITRKIRNSKLQLQQQLLETLQAQESVIKEQAQSLAQKEMDTVLNSLSTQIAHDIRSPLAALNMVFSDLPQMQMLPENSRSIIHLALNRIHDIANQLLNQNQKVPVIINEVLSPTLLSYAIDSILTEKRLNFRSLLGVEIRGTMDASSYGLFAQVQPTEFGRVLSNLINNAVEAIHDIGLVEVILTATADHVFLTIRDNGVGIPQELLPLLGEKGRTHGKVGGSGLGLYHARSKITEWGGSLSIESKLGQGTTLTIQLPRPTAPAWFVPKIELHHRQNLVILDDDTSIHKVWKTRIEDLAKIAGTQFRRHHLSTPDELQAWIARHPQEIENTLFLCDYELLGFDQNGLDIIDQGGIKERSILVTGRFAEAKLRTRAEQLGVKLIPKGLASMVPLTFSEKI